MAYNYAVDSSNGAYSCEEGVTCQDICQHFECTEEELYECNGGCEPECYCGAIIYIPERCYKSDYSAVNYSHKAEETCYSSEQGHNSLSQDGCDPCYGHGSLDACNDYSKVNFSNKSEETNYSSVQASEQEHVGGQAFHVPAMPVCPPTHGSYSAPRMGY
jgi:hypothetical protein